MGHKVVINECYGGFGLSDAAIFALKQLGIETSADRIPRHLPELVYVVDQLGPEANGEFAKLVIVELEGNMYRIQDYDGWESILEPDDTVWTTIE